MKKLLSICFLSILLGLLSFSTRAQSSGFWIENLQPETITGVANAPSGNGTLVLDNVLNPAEVGNTDLYEIHFCPSQADLGKKVSIDWLLYRDGQLVNENLSNYADFYIYTLYPELNIQGQCQSIHWLGGQMPNNFGYCEQPAEPDMFSGYHCNTPVNYPGATQVAPGAPAPNAVYNNINTGEWTSALGSVSVYTEGLNYFYANFLASTRTVVQIRWRQVGNYSLVMRVREQVGGTDWNNLTWNGSETQYIGGHQSCCGQIIAQDSIHYLVTGDFSKEVCENEPYNFGTIVNYCPDPENPIVDNHLFTQSVDDTLVIFGYYAEAHCCNHLVVDSLYNFHFFQRNTPDAIVHDTTICQCTPLTPQDIINMVGYDQEDINWAYNSYLQWYVEPETVEIGTGTATTDYLPLYIWFKKNYTQQIYTSEEVGGAGLISGISFYHTSTNSHEYNVKIYLSSTSKDEFATTTDWDLTPKTLVYEGPVNFSGDGWITFPFDNAYNYDGAGNLLLTVIGYADSYQSGHKFYKFNTEDGSYKAIYKYQDSDPILTDETIVGVNGTRQTYRNVIRLERAGGWFDEPFVPSTDVEVADYEYQVRQVNEYANFDVLDGSHKDTVVCEGALQTFHITIEPMFVTLPEDAEFCVADFTDTTLLVVTADHGDDNCATTTRWYAANGYEPDYSEVIFEGDNFVISHELLADYFNFEANQDGEVVFFAVAYNANLDCLGKIAMPYIITFHQTPVLTATVTPDSLNCPGSEAHMKVKITNNPLQVDNPFVYHWTGVDEVSEPVTDLPDPVVAIPEDNYYSSTTTQMPDYTLYNYSYTQQIFTSEELRSGTITKISFYPNAVADYENAKTRKLAFYLSVTDKENLSDGWDLQDNKQLVYCGTYTFTAQQWNDFELTVPFEYDATQGNLLVTCIDSTGAWKGGTNFYYTSTSDVMGRYAYRDGSPFDNNITVTGTSVRYRNNMRFEFAQDYQEGRIPVGEPVSQDFTLPYNGTTELLPLWSYDEYNYTQQLFTADEVTGGVEGTITKLTFDYRGLYDLTVKNDVDIYLGHTDKVAFTDEDDLVPMEDLQLVYSGNFNCAVGQNKEIVLDTPFEFDGTSNLVVVLHDMSGTWQSSYDYDYDTYSYISTRCFGVNYADNMAAVGRYDDYFDDPDYMGEDNNTYSFRTVYDYRNNITFTATVTPSPYTILTYNNGYKELSKSCNEAYESTVFVVDDNGCKSNVVTFNYQVGDTIAPVITPATAEWTINTCDSAELYEAMSDLDFTDIQAFSEFMEMLPILDSQTGHGSVSDNCGLDNLAVSYGADVFTPRGENCEMSLMRTFTVKDSCGNTATFTFTLIGHDQDAPEFVDYVNPSFEFRPIRLLPVPAGDCKYNAPSLEVLKATIRPYVTDACTDVDYLMNNIEFVWENLSDTIPVADAQDIFIHNNHLTIAAFMHDRCNNQSDTINVFFLDRPENLTINESAFQPEQLCYGATTTVTFNPANIVVDPIMGAFAPFTYTWSDTANGDVTFSNPNGLTTTVTFNGAGDYYIVMTVTDTNGCSAVSEVRHFHVRPELQVAIEPIVLNGATEPYCPTYGNLTVEAVVTGEYNFIRTYEWSGESVNIASTSNTTWVTIIPEWCDTTYTPAVHVVDDHYCEANTSRVFTTAAQGIVLNGELDDVYVNPIGECNFYVPDFQGLITRDMISDACYTYSEITAEDDWYTQVPAAGTEFTTESKLVTITIKNPCGKTTETTLYVHKFGDYPTVAINPESYAACYEEIAESNGVFFSATGTNLGNNPTFEWTVEDEEVGYTANLILPNANWDLVNEEYTYTVAVTATNVENGCTATAEVPFTVHYQGDPVKYHVWNNTMCTPGHYNGMISVDTVPMYYTVILNGLTVNYDSVIRVNDVPNHEHSDWNTIYFDSLQSGLYQVTIINLFECEVRENVYVGSSEVVLDEPVFVVTDQSECNGNGTLTITAEAGYSFALKSGNQLIGTGLFYNNLFAGDYTIVKTQLATGCSDEFPATIEDVTVPEVIAATATDAYNCPTPNNGTITVTSETSGLRYRIVELVDNYTTSNFYPKSGSMYNNNEALYVNAGTTGKRYYTTNTTFSGLTVGTYKVIAYNPSTGCYGFDTVTIEDARVPVDFTVSTTPNNYCQGPTYNGTITASSTTGINYNYTLVLRQGSGTVVNSNVAAASAGVYENLIPYSYNRSRYELTGKDPNTNCTLKVENIQIADDLYIPEFDTLSTTPNSVCDLDYADAYNGGVVLDVTATGNNVNDGTPQTCSYTIYMHDSYGDGWNGGSLTFTQNNTAVKTVSLSSGYEGTDVVNLLSNVETVITFNSGSWPSEITFEVVSDFDDNTLCTKSDVYPFTFTPSCGDAPSVTPAEAFLTYVQPYTVKIDGASKGTYTTANPSFTGLQEGSHTITVTSNTYKCSVTHTVDIRKENIPAMVLTSTPDHFCAPTFEKPGDGTIHIESPVADATHTYTYKFFDAFDNEMTVPYDLPMTHTKYWLAHGRYRVLAVEMNTGCTVQGYETVDWEPYTISFDTVTTPDEFCTATLGNGTITVINAQVSNPDVIGDFVYSIDGGTTFQTSNVFTGLNADPDNPYIVTVKDLTTACVADAKVVFINNDECAPVIDSIYDNFGQGTEFHYCFGTPGIYLNGAAHDACDNTPLEYYWSAPCADPTSSNTSSIEVQTDHYVVGGCYYTLTVRNPQTECITSRMVTVYVHPLPDLYVRINGDSASTTHYNEYCENVPLTLTVYNKNQEPLDIESIQWTQGYTATGVQSIHVVGTDYENDVVTFCVRANNIFDCGSGVISVPVKFNRIVTKNVVMTRCDGECFITEPNGQITEINKPAGEDYPYSTTVTRTYVNPATGCDSIVNYQITLYGAPELAMGQINPDAFCEDDNKTLADFTPAATDIDWNGLEGTATWMAADLGYTYTKVTSAADLTAGEYVITNAAGTKAMSSVRAASNYYYPGVNFNADNVTASNITWNLTVNADGTYSLSNDYGYLYISTSTGNAYINPTMAPATKFTATFTNNGVVFENNYWDGYALKYNNSANRFAGYATNNNNLYHLAFYKKTNEYEEVPATRVVDYEFATTHSVKYVVTNNCGSDEAVATFNVSKKPEIDTFDLASKYCALQPATLNFRVKAYNPATATLTLDGETVETYNLTVGMNYLTYNFVPSWAGYNEKTLNLTVVNNNNLCAAATEDETFVVDTNIKKITKPSAYCEGDVMTYSQFLTVEDYENVQMHVVAPAGYKTDNYTLTYSDNNMQVYFTMQDLVCHNDIITDTATITVKPLPHVALNQDGNIYDVCEEDFTMPTVTITPAAVETLITYQGWQMQNAQGKYVYTTTQAIKAAAADHSVNIRYYVETNCGNDSTAVIPAYYKNLPDLFISMPYLVCPNTTLGSVISNFSIDWHNGVNDQRDTIFQLVKGSNVTTVTPAMTFNDYTTVYNGGIVRVIARNECGSDTVDMDLHIVVYNHNTFVKKDTCKGLTLEDFIATQPQWTGSSNAVESGKWQKRTLVGQTFTWSDMNTTDQINATTVVRYVWHTYCGDDVPTQSQILYPLETPTVAITDANLANDTIVICENSTIDPQAVITYPTHSSTVTDTTWYFDGAAFNPAKQFTPADNGKELVVMISTTCQNAYDTVIVKVNPNPIPTVSGDTIICTEQTATLRVNETYASYQWYDGDDNQITGATSQTYTFEAPTTEGLYNFYVVVTDQFGCASTTEVNTSVDAYASDVLTVKVSNAPQFIFKDMAGNRTHHLDAVTGEFNYYTWQVDKQCTPEDELVFVEFTIYYGQDEASTAVIPVAEIGEYFATQTYQPVIGGANKPWISSDEMNWYTSEMNYIEKTLYYNSSVPGNETDVMNGNHFPNTNLYGLGAVDYYESLYLHFLDDNRVITKTLVPFRHAGEYKIVYRLFSTSNHDYIQNYYKNSKCNCNKWIGGQNAFVGVYTGSTVITELAVDSIMFTVTGEDMVTAQNNDVAPQLAPAITMDENVVAPEMEVWPNPAPAITTTFKARVHHLSGEATVTITTLTGKQIYSDKMYIDSDNYYFEADVDNLSLGSYIMTVRTADAVISKKLVVMVSAK